ncbi:RagB/SusD family nutrient uptake outer membrane protein [Paenimyroides ummariense]|nr:RagB/SusD family nutrient uptake outer membrane protein [Paenimyroides ummariense]
MKKIMIYTVSFWILLLATGCNDFLEVEVPKDMVDQTKTFNDDRTAEAALHHAYVLLTENGFLSGNAGAAPVLLGCYTDELEVTSPAFPDYMNFYNGAVLANNSSVSALWNQTYAQIYTVNNILEGLKNSTGITEAVQIQLQGEALAIRGILHFYLAQTFGEVPYVTSVDYKVNQKIGKLSVNAVMERALADLKDAEEILLSSYPTAERIRISKSVVHGFMARMYLYMENWPMARQYAEVLINNTEYTLSPVNGLFLKESKSAIWQLKPTINGMNTYEALTYTFFAVPAPNIKLSTSLLGIFETGDLRKTNWIKFIGLEGQNAHNFKYTKMGFSTPVAEYSVVLRIEEMYLIAAEAAARLQDWDACNGYLNQIRSRAGLDDVDVQSVDQAVNTILQERRVELFCEFGHRFYDLKRTDRLMDLQAVKPNWKPHLSVLPLPENELLLNPNLLPQNTGY